MGVRGTGKPQQQRGKWRIRWLDENGKRSSEVYDAYNDAVSALRRQEREVEEIHRGERLSLPAEKTFDDLCDSWLERRAKRKRSRKDDECIIRKHLRPAFGAMLLRELVQPSSTDRIDDFTDQLHESVSEKTVANILTHFIAMLNYAKDDRRWIVFVPKIAKPKIRNQCMDGFVTRRLLSRRLAFESFEGGHLYGRCVAVHSDPVERPKPVAKRPAFFGAG